jgi:glycosyltransferase involved in cell wall biosynthesis
MRISIYCQPCGASLGGAEYSAAVLAEGLCREHEVTLYHSARGLTVGSFESFAQVALSNVKLRVPLVQGNCTGCTANPLTRLHQSREINKELSLNYDAFITFTHAAPPYCYAPKGILIVLFPGNDRRELWPWSAGRNEKPSLRRWLRGLLAEWNWWQRLSGYTHKTSISEFTREWTKRWWGVNTTVLYPPVFTDFQIREKRNIILSVGRFIADERPKNQKEMMQAFSEMRPARDAGWRYLSVGGLGENSTDLQYFNRVTELGQTIKGETRANVPRSELIGHFEEARIYWHAGGLGVDETSQPLTSEHFGITPVEAMAAGCVPVVINRGGLKETVVHGVSGFLWNTLDELKYYTLLLIQDEALLLRMSMAARERSKLFSHARFIESVKQLLRQ